MSRSSTKPELCEVLLVCYLRLACCSRELVKRKVYGTMSIGLAILELDAAFKGDAHAVAAWLEKGGGVDAGCAENNDVTLLMMAAAGGHEAMVRMLLERGASINLQESLGCTALVGAAEQGHTTTVQVLLDAKANASLQTEFGYTALMAAEQEKHTAIAQLLRQHAERQSAEAEAAAMYAAATVPTPNLSGRRVRIAGLKGRPELNGRCGVAGRFDAAKGRYAVAVEGEAEAVLLKPANLQETTSDLPMFTQPNPNFALIESTPTCGVCLYKIVVSMLLCW